MPSSGVGVGDSRFFEYWLGRGAYDPEVIDIIGDDEPVPVAHERADLAQDITPARLGLGRIWCERDV